MREKFRRGPAPGIKEADSMILRADQILASLGRTEVTNFDVSKACELNCSSLSDYKTNMVLRIAIELAETKGYALLHCEPKTDNLILEMEDNLYVATS
jgi:hypothetical protein